MVATCWNVGLAAHLMLLSKFAGVMVATAAAFFRLVERATAHALVVLARVMLARQRRLLLLLRCRTLTTRTSNKQLGLFALGLCIRQNKEVNIPNNTKFKYEYMK